MVDLSDRMRRKFKQAGCTFRPSEIDPLLVCGYGPDGGYIAPTCDNRRWEWLARLGAFEPQKACLDDRVCSVALVSKGEHSGKWVGWSHRSAAVFGVGDMLFDASLLHESSEWEDVPFNKVGTIEITTESQARQAACNFSEYLS